MNRSLLLLCGVLSISVGVFAVEACSTGGTGTPSGTGGSGGSGGSGAKDSSTEGEEDTGTSVKRDSGATDGGVEGGSLCDRKLPELHPNDAGTIFCPFGPDGSLRCESATQHCCQPNQGAGASSCEDRATDCPVAAAGDGGADWACDETAHCPNGEVCCATAAQPPAVDNRCGNSFSSARFFWGTQCRAACQAGEFRICQNAQGECPSETPTCEPFSVRGKEIGYCK